jgi:CubicO group peptidase (beta-lactamase class C family)
LPFPSGASGLVSTLDDYLAFGRMLLGGGIHDGRRLLSRPTVAAMTSEQLTREQKERSPFFPGFWDGRGWGLGVSLVTNRSGPASTPGSYGWSGGFGTEWTCDPVEDLCTVVLTQRLGADDLFADFLTGVYAAIDD